MVKMYITGENDFEKDSSYAVLWPKQKNVEKMAIFGQFPLYNWSNLKSAGTLPQLTKSF